MEFQPEGMVNLTLVLPDGTHEQYTWNKVTITQNELFTLFTLCWQAHKAQFKALF